MTSRLLTPPEALAALRRRIEQKWADAVCAEHGIAAPVRFQVQLRAGISTGRAVEKLGFAPWHEWRTAWRTFGTDVISTIPGAAITGRPVTVRGLTDEVPAVMLAETLDAAVQLIDQAPSPNSIVDVARARALSTSLQEAGGIVTPAILKAAYRLADSDAAVLVSAVSWLRDHPDVSDWTARQLPVPGMHSKWLENHGSVLRMVSGRDVRAEVRPRLAVVHLTYVDPGHTASGRRRHDAWTTGDVHDLAYKPKVVLIVENRDCRLWFPPTAHTIVVEGNGKAAASILADIPWIRYAENVVYWGDIDADGYAILDRLRATLATPTPAGLPARSVHSILMDASDLHRYASHGVNHDKAGQPIKPGATILTHLTRSEASAYDYVTTSGSPAFRRIEQEAIPLLDAATRLEAVVTSFHRHDASYPSDTVAPHEIETGRYGFFPH
ncbi:hypothetical protein B7C42_06883 [Nocardia cerradoensis]|uniref:Wadjet protein JetD C-terminal domain-containing protein n=1 Tax=Nocardia cerradoensis TaxID=85688 RepID=A0A231GWW8_9NOCA|nr:DUF3322 and DUF2220 domain-containing protein [Nocardia cerradoensis]OXR41113.1 hypothetical protein B7C42_06883 [Nocardia cerradoensis]